MSNILVNNAAQSFGGALPGTVKRWRPTWYHCHAASDVRWLASVEVFQSFVPISVAQRRGNLCLWGELG